MGRGKREGFQRYRESLAIFHGWPWESAWADGCGNISIYSFTLIVDLGPYVSRATSFQGIKYHVSYAILILRQRVFVVYLLYRAGHINSWLLGRYTY